MEFLLIQVLNGLGYAMLLFLMAAGLSLIFGLMNVVNLAHGSFFMVGAYLGLSIYGLTHSFWLALILAPIPTAMVGAIIERVFLRHLYRRGHLDQVLLTFGFTFVFFDVVRTIWGSDVRSLPLPTLFAGVIRIADGAFSAYRLFLLALGLALAVVLWVFIERSRIGAMVRAGVDDAGMAAGLGCNIPALFTGVFSGGVALAGLGGVAAGPVLGLYPGLDADILIPAFIVVVIGGMGSLRGAFAGSLLVGEIDTFGKAYFPSTALFLVYAMMAIVLLVRPQGIFGIEHADGTSRSTAPPPVAHTNALRSKFAGAVILTALVLFLVLVSDYPRTLVAEIYLFAIVAMSLDLLLGYTGLLSMGHAAFFGLGAYAVIILATFFHLEAWLGVLAGVILAAACAAVIGYFCVRTSGVTLLMLTLAFSQLIYSIAIKWRDVTGGSDGIGVADRPGFFGFDLSNTLVMYYMTLFFFVLSYWGLARLIGSPLGHTFIGIRENEQRMLAIGYATPRYKLLAFTISGMVAGFAGGLYAIFNGFISPDAVQFSASGDILIMVMLGGTGTLIGPIIGSSIFLLMKNLVSSYSSHWMLIIGAVFIACVLYFPGGIWGTVRLLQSKRPLP
jgi:branched-chain amino acid transport system permease protein